MSFNCFKQREQVNLPVLNTVTDIQRSDVESCPEPFIPLSIAEQNSQSAESTPESKRINRLIVPNLFTKDHQASQLSCLRSKTVTTGTTASSGWFRPITNFRTTPGFSVHPFRSCITSHNNPSEKQSCNLASTSSRQNSLTNLVSSASDQYPSVSSDNPACPWDIPTTSSEPPAPIRQVTGTRDTVTCLVRSQSDSTCLSAIANQPPGSPDATHPQPVKASAEPQLDSNLDRNDASVSSSRLDMSDLAVSSLSSELLEEECESECCCHQSRRAPPPGVHVRLSDGPPTPSNTSFSPQTTLVSSLSSAPPVMSRRIYQLICHNGVQSYTLISTDVREDASPASQIASQFSSGSVSYHCHRLSKQYSSSGSNHGSSPEVNAFRSDNTSTTCPSKPSESSLSNQEEKEEEWTDREIDCLVSTGLLFNTTSAATLVDMAYLTPAQRTMPQHQVKLRGLSDAAGSKPAIASPPLPSLPSYPHMTSGSPLQSIGPRADSQQKRAAAAGCAPGGSRPEAPVPARKQRGSSAAPTPPNANTAAGLSEHHQHHHHQQHPTTTTTTGTPSRCGGPLATSSGAAPVGSSRPGSRPAPVPAPGSTTSSRSRPQKDEQQQQLLLLMHQRNSIGNSPAGVAGHSNTQMPRLEQRVHHGAAAASVALKTPTTTTTAAAAGGAANSNLPRSNRHFASVPTQPPPHYLHQHQHQLSPEPGSSTRQQGPPPAIANYHPGYHPHEPPRQTLLASSSSSALLVQAPREGHRQQPPPPCPTADSDHHHHHQSASEESKMTLAELRSIAERQRQTLARQARQLQAKEERLAWLRSARGGQGDANNEEKHLPPPGSSLTGDQEARLTKLRGLRGQTEQARIANEKLVDEIDHLARLLSTREHELAACRQRTSEAQSVLATVETCQHHLSTAYTRLVAGDQQLCDLQANPEQLSMLDLSACQLPFSTDRDRKRWRDGLLETDYLDKQFDLVRAVTWTATPSDPPPTPPRRETVSEQLQQHQPPPPPRSNTTAVAAVARTGFPTHSTTGAPVPASRVNHPKPTVASSLAPIQLLSGSAIPHNYSTSTLNTTTGTSDTTTRNTGGSGGFQGLLQRANSPPSSSRRSSLKMLLTPVGGTTVDGVVPSPRRKAPLRYASRAVINNTYMRRICRDSVEKYKQTANEIYRATVDRLATGEQQQPVAASSLALPDHEDANTLLVVETQEAAGSKFKDTLLPVASPSSPSSSSDSASSSSSSLQLTTDGRSEVTSDRKVGFEDDIDDEEEEGRQSFGDVDSGLGGSDDTATSERLSNGGTAAVKLSPLVASGNGAPRRVPDVPSAQQQHKEEEDEDAIGTDTSISNFVCNTNSSSVEVKSILRKPSLDSTASSQPVSRSGTATKYTFIDQQKQLRNSADTQQQSSGNSSSIVAPSSNSVRFHPLALLLDAALEGDLELVKLAASQVTDVSEPNDEGITALHNAVCAGRTDIADFLVRVAGADVNAGDTDGWTPLHCAASCGNLPLARLLVEHGAALHARTLSDQETPLEKCDQGDEQAECEEYLFFQQERLGSAATGRVYALFPRGLEAAGPGSPDAHVASDELPLRPNEVLTVIDRDPAGEVDWVLAEKSDGGPRGLVPRSHISCYPLVRVPPASLPQPERKPTQRTTGAAPPWWWSLDEAAATAADNNEGDEHTPGELGMMVVVGPGAGDNSGLDDDDEEDEEDVDYSGGGGGGGDAEMCARRGLAEYGQHKGSRGSTTCVLVQMEPGSEVRAVAASGDTDELPKSWLVNDVKAREEHDSGEAKTAF